MKILRYIAAFVMLAGAALANSSYPSTRSVVSPGPFTMTDVAKLSASQAASGTYQYIVVPNVGTMVWTPSAANAQYPCGAPVGGVGTIGVGNLYACPSDATPPATGRWVVVPANVAKATGILATTNGGDPCIVPEQYGAVGDGVADDSLAVQAVENAGKALGRCIFYGKTYAIKRQTVWKAPARFGVPNTVTFIIAADYSSSPPLIQGGVCAFVNDGFTTKNYNDATAFESAFTDITVRNDSTYADGTYTGAPTALRFANVKRLSMIRTKLYTNTVSRMDALLDLYASVNNVIIDGLTIVNSTPLANVAGGGMWVRNLTDTPANAEANANHNIELRNIDITVRSVDEGLAIWASYGGADNIRVTGGRIQNMNDEPHGVLLSVYEVNSNPYTFLSNVVVEGLKIRNSNTTNTVAQLSNRANANPFNVIFKDSTLSVQTSTSVQGLYSAPGTVGAVADNITIDATGSATPLNYGFYGPLIIRGGRITGNYTTAATACTSVDHLTALNSIGTPISNCSIISNNTLSTSSTYGILVAAPIAYSVHGNHITMSANNKYAVGINNGAYGMFYENSIVTQGSTSLPFNVGTAGSGPILIFDNMAAGIGYGAFNNEQYVTRAWGNNFYGALHR